MFKNLLITVALSTIITSAHAAGSANFGVTGSILPGACAVTLTNGVVNLGTITNTAAKSYAIYQGAYTIPPVTIPISITCSKATKIAVSLVDNFAGKILSLDSADALRYGMVDGAGTVAIGAYHMNFSGVTIDNVAVAQFMTAVNGTRNWATTSVGGASATFIAPGYSTAFSKTASSIVPDTFTTLVGNLNMAPYISTSYVNAATSAITPIGSGTLAVVYL